MDQMILLTSQQIQSIVENAVRKVLNEKQSVTRTNDDAGPLTLKEAADYLNISTSTLYRYTSQRLIPHDKPGKYVYFHRNELDSWLREHRKHTKQEIESEDFILKTGLGNKTFEKNRKFLGTATNNK